MQETYNIPLHDIKPLVEIQEYSLVYFIGLSSVAVVLLLGFIYLLVKWFKKRNVFNIRKEHYKLLNKVNLQDAKRSAYDITFYGATFKDDSPRHADTYKNLVQKLEEYKYKKDVKKIDEDVLHYIEFYKGMIDV